MAGSKRLIEKELWKMFYDDQAKEFTSAPYSRKNILFILHQFDNRIEWIDIYRVIKNWQYTCDKHYNGISNEDKLLLEAGVTDTRQICERKYQDFIILITEEKKVPLYYDKDISEYRVAKTLQIYEEFQGERIYDLTELRNEKMKNLTKRGGKVLSGLDSRTIIFDFIEESKKLSRKEYIEEIVREAEESKEKEANSNNEDKEED